MQGRFEVADPRKSVTEHDDAGAESRAPHHDKQPDNFAGELESWRLLGCHGREIDETQKGR